MGESERLADLSHSIDREALRLCRERINHARIERSVIELSEGHREAVAVALSYALRRRELEGPTPTNDRAVAALAGAVRQMGIASGQDGGTS